MLPELDKAFSNRFDVLTDREDPTGPIDAVFRHAKDEVRAMSPQLQRAYAQRRQRQRQEDLCGLYVAMTRAKQALYLIAKPIPQRQGQAAEGRPLRRGHPPRHPRRPGRGLRGGRPRLGRRGFFERR